MKLLLSMVVVSIVADIIVGQAPDKPNSTANYCCITGEKGVKGEQGQHGAKGGKGIRGEPGMIIYEESLGLCSRGQSCPKGYPGLNGQKGYKGVKGGTGITGPPGEKGLQGSDGEPGRPGPPGKTTDNILFLPYLPYHPSDGVCYSFKRYCYVPGIANGWRGWSRKGKSGFLVHSNWLYFVSLAKCPCTFKEPHLPQPVNPSECRQGNCG